MIKLDFSTVNILVQRPTHISAVATERERDRQTVTERDWLPFVCTLVHGIHAVDDHFKLTCPGA